MSPSRTSHRGSTLIEAMAALVVFTIGIIGVMDMNILASEQNNLARSRTVASKIARDVADSFERIPFNHPALNTPTTLDPDTEEFSNIENGDGLVTLSSAVGMPGERPMLGAADALFTTEISQEDGRPFYQVAWRAVRVANPERSNVQDQVRVLIMVRFPAPGGGLIQMNTWAVRYDVGAITGDNATLLEL